MGATEAEIGWRRCDAMLGEVMKERDAALAQVAALREALVEIHHAIEPLVGIARLSEKQAFRTMGDAAVPVLDQSHAMLAATSTAADEFVARVRAEGRAKNHALLNGQARLLIEDTRAKALEEAAPAVLGGRFMHDQAPTALFAREVAAMLRALAAKGTS